MKLDGKKYGNLQMSGKPIKGICNGGCKILIMEKAGAFSSKIYYYPFNVREKIIIRVQID